MLEKTRTVVNICGREYAMAGVESEEYIHRVAIYVDKKMNEFKNNYVNLSPTDLAVLTALNIADEFLKLRYDHTGAAEEISELKDELKKAKIENALLKEEKKDKVMSMKKEAGNKLFDSYK